MSETRHHPPDEMLLRYAAGETDEAEALVLACHLSLCGACRLRVQELETLGGELLREQPAGDARIDDERLLATTLARLDAPPPVWTAPRAPAPQCPVLPAPLTRYVGPLEALPWKKRVPGLSVVELPLAHHGVPLRLKHMRAGMEIPMHSHHGPELELVLMGGATDGVDGSQFLRGDVAYNDAEREHYLTIDDDGPCIALGLQSGRMRPRGLWSHLVFGWLGW